MLPSTNRFVITAIGRAIEMSPNSALSSTHSEPLSLRDVVTSLDVHMASRWLMVIARPSFAAWLSTPANHQPQVGKLLEPETIFDCAPVSVSGRRPELSPDGEIKCLVDA